MKIQFELPEVIARLIPDQPYYEWFLLGLSFNYDESGIVTIQSAAVDSDYFGGLS